MSSDSSQATDLELQFKKRARRRLVGAIALVLVMLVVLPMLLEDHEQNTPQQAVTISIPSQNAEFTTQAPIQTPTPIQTPAPAAPNPVLESAVVETPKSDATESPEVKSINHFSANAGAKEDVEKKSVEIKKIADPKMTKEVKVADDKKDKLSTSTLDKGPNTKQSTPDNPHTSEKSGAEAKALDDSGKPYYLQIGVFSESVNVTHLQKKLSEVKLKSYTEKIATEKGEKTRLRVGPFDNKEQADRASDKLKIIGLSGFVSNR